MKALKPHGIDVICSYSVLNKEIKELPKSVFEGYIEIENLQRKTKLVLPMRSFVDGFINALHGILSGDEGADTRIRSVSATATAASNSGLVIGDGDVAVQLSDTDLVSKNSATSSLLTAVHKGTTFTAPYSGGAGQINFDVRRLISNASTEGWTIKEMGLFARRNSATLANNGASSTLMLSRDHFRDGITFPYNADIRITFRFVAVQGATGGINMNFARAIYNLMIVGAINNPASRIISKNNSINSYTYATGASATVTNPLSAVAATSIVNGIVVGYELSNLIGGTETDGSGDFSTPPVPDETTFTINHTNLTVSAVTISPVAAGTGTSKFTITRDFTNTGTGNKLINRVGILTYGNGIGNTQPFIAVNKPSTITLQPQQSLRVTYTIQTQL